MEIETESTKAEKTSPQPKGDAENSSGSSSHSPKNSSSPTNESSSQINSCSCGKDKCMDCDYRPFTTMMDRSSEMKKTDEALTTECMTKFKSLTVKDHCSNCPDNCSRRSGCSNCHYRLITYSTANKIKSKSKINKKLGVTSSNVFRLKKPLERKRRILKKFRRRRARKPKSSESKTSESCYSTSSSNCDSKSVAGYSKRGSKLCATNGQTLKNKKNKSTKNSTKSKKLARTAKILKRRKRNIRKNKMAKFSESNRKRKFYTSNSCDCNSGCMNCGRHINMKRKRLKNRSVKAKATMSSSEPCSSVTTESVESKKSLKQKARSFTKRSSSCTSYKSPPPENDSCFSEDCSNTRLSRRKSA